jgi:hypothetical protein
MATNRKIFKGELSEMSPAATKMVDMILRVIGVVMGIAAVSLLALHIITIEDAVILLGIGIVAIALERLSES